jgi:hypothetical protein
MKIRNGLTKNKGGTKRVRDTKSTKRVRLLRLDYLRRCEQSATLFTLANPQKRGNGVASLLLIIGLLPICAEFQRYDFSLRLLSRNFRTILCGSHFPSFFANSSIFREASSILRLLADDRFSCFVVAIAFLASVPN